MSPSFNFKLLTFNWPRRVIGGLIILAISLSMFAVPVKKAEAENCYAADGYPLWALGEANCKDPTRGGNLTNVWRDPLPTDQPIQTAPATSGSTLKDQLGDYNCGILPGSSIVPGCAVQLSYIIFVSVPSFLMKMAAKVFDLMAQLTLSSAMYGKEFIEKIWRVVRDFANIFFILILLYAAFQIMLDLGHGGGKKIIAAVILIALVVNFSLFFTKIVIDASNIVALIFYNRIDTKDVPQDQNIGSERPLAAALISRFDINAFFDGSIMEKIKEENLEEAIRIRDESCKQTGASYVCSQDTVNSIKEKIEGISAFALISIMIAYGIMAFALVYAFLVVGLSFLGRLITLIMLMIISPFAFVTFAVPKFKGINTIGFDSWIKQLFTVSFVAAIFMFILYVVSEILAAKIFDDAVTNSQPATTAMLLIFIPAALIVMALLKGAKYARSASGELTEKIIGGAKMLGGAALGGAIGGAALLGTQTFGRIGTGVASSDKRREMAANEEGKYSKWQQVRAKMALGAGNFLGKRSYDVRQVGLAKAAAGKVGIKLADKGLGPLGTKSFEKGRAGQIERRIDKEQEKVKTILLTKAGEARQEERIDQYQKDLVRALGAEAEKRKDRFQTFTEDDKKKFMETFKGTYERGGDLSGYGLNKKVESGSLKSVVDINDDRRRAYAASLVEGGTLKQAMRGLLGGMGKMIPAGAGVAAAGAIAGGTAVGAVGAGTLVIGGGILQALKDGFNRLDRSTLEVAAAVRKPPPADKEIKDYLRKIAGGEKVSEEKLSDISRKMGDLGKGGSGEKGGGEEHK